MPPGVGIDDCHADGPASTRSLAEFFGRGWLNFLERPRDKNKFSSFLDILFLDHVLDVFLNSIESQDFGYTKLSRIKIKSLPSELRSCKGCEKHNANNYSNSWMVFQIPKWCTEFFHFFVVLIGPTKPLPPMFGCHVLWDQLRMIAAFPLRSRPYNVLKKPMLAPGRSLRPSWMTSFRGLRFQKVTNTCAMWIREAIGLTICWVYRLKNSPRNEHFGFLVGSLMTTNHIWGMLKTPSGSAERFQRVLQFRAAVNPFWALFSGGGHCESHNKTQERQQGGLAAWRLRCIFFCPMWLLLSFFQSLFCFSKSLIISAEPGSRRFVCRTLSTMAREIHDALVKAGLSEEQRAAVLQELNSAPPAAPAAVPAAPPPQHIHVHFHGAST